MTNEINESNTSSDKVDETSIESKATDDESNESEYVTEKSETINISYTTMYKLGSFIIILILAIMLFRSFSSTSAITQVTGNAVNVPSNNAQAVATTSADGVQIVKMRVDGSTYVLEPSQVKAGVPVRIVGDISQMPGCSKSVVIPAFNIRQTLTSSSNTIEFTPTKAGTFNIACSMNMYKGTITVLQSDGTKANYVEAPNTAGHTCGGSGGGGCGGGCGG